MKYVTEPARQIPVRYEADIFVAGGSCTGVFAAVRAARLGARVVLAERQNCLGGMATAALVNVWHSLKDTDYKEQVIGGLTAEVTERLYRAGAAVLKDDPSVAIRFDPFRLQYELDCLVKENRITVLFHTLCVGVLTDGAAVTGAIIENKDGRSAVSAGFFVDATGDGDLAGFLGLPKYRHPVVQPPTPCFLMQGNTEGLELGKLIREHGKEFGLPDDFGWSESVPGLDGLSMRADCHVFGEDCASAEGLTAIETEGRRKAYALAELIRTYTDRNVKVAGLSALAGVRESNHYETDFTLTGEDLLLGKRYDDAVLNGTYRVDMHGEDGSCTFRYLSGEALRMEGAERRTVRWDWRKEMGLTGEPAKYYQAPFRMLVQKRYGNFIAAGRMLHSDAQAFGALRVMVNLNQLGEAAGTAAWLSVDSGKAVWELDGTKVRSLLRQGGSAL